MTAVAIGIIILACFGMLGGPFLIGRPREALTSGVYIGHLIAKGATILLAGRVLGWW